MTRLISWVDAANVPGCDFPLENLPYCAFKDKEGDSHLGVGIGTFVFDLCRAADSPLFSSLPNDVRSACRAPHLNALMACGKDGSRALRQSLLAGFAAEAPQAWRAPAEQLLQPTASTSFRTPVLIGDYTDFYASLHHATNVGRLFRPEQPLLPNYKFVPIGYHGRASSIVVSGTPLVRPQGQRKTPEAVVPEFGRCMQLDFELEMGVYLGRGNELGRRVDISEAAEYIFGFSLLNDWSARDIQAWEYQPLGPFLSKNFMTSVSPWVVPLAALEPYRVAQCARPAGDPEPLAYLSGGREPAAFDIQVEASLTTHAMRQRHEPAVKLASSNVKDLYWTFAQMITHHASSGCNLRIGDLLGSGTISGSGIRDGGSLLELTLRGNEPLQLPGGETRKFLEDGDELVMHAFCERDGLPRIGFGECRGVVQAAHGGDHVQY